MATHSSILAWRIPGTGEPGGLLSMGSHRVGHNWSDFVAAAAAELRGQLTDWRLSYVFVGKGNSSHLMVRKQLARICAMKLMGWKVLFLMEACWIKALNPYLFCVFIYQSTMVAVHGVYRSQASMKNHSFYSILWSKYLRLPNFWWYKLR